MLGRIPRYGALKAAWSDSDPVKLGVGIGVVTIASVLVFVVAPALAKSPKDVGSARSAMLQLLGGLILAIGALFSVRTFHLNRTKQITDRFTEAIAQLGNEKVEIRLGGIYALEHVAREPRSDHHPQVMDVLTAYVRMHAPWPPDSPRDPPNSGDGDQPMPIQPPKVDIQTILTVLGRRVRKYDTTKLNLASVDIRGADLTDAHFEGADLTQAHLGGANLTLAHLDGAMLTEAQLTSANLIDAVMQDADLRAANFAGAMLFGANLSRADLTGSNISAAQIGMAASPDA